MNLLTRATLLCLFAPQAFAFQSTSQELPFSAGQAVNSEQQIQEFSYSVKHEPMQKTSFGGCNASPIPGCNYPRHDDPDFRQK
ncbi:hypothetical protein [Enterobacter sp. UPMP2052]